jgi:hypothetical protein
MMVEALLAAGGFVDLSSYTVAEVRIMTAAVAHRRRLGRQAQAQEIAGLIARMFGG